MSSTSPTTVDPLDSLLDLSDYDTMPAYNSPSLSPAASKTPFIKPESTLTSPTTATLTPSQSMSGPSHQYELYKQQTGIVPGALASTLAVNNPRVTGYNWNMDYLSGLSTDNELFDFNTAPSQGSLGDSEMDMDFNSPSGDTSLFFGDSTINPSAVAGESSTMPSPMPSTTSQVGRLYPGMHQQAALAKAQAQRQQIAQQQQRQSVQNQGRPRPKGTPPTDPIVEQKITQLLNSMRAKPSTAGSDANSPQTHLPRMKKDEDDMDEDERLLASEEGKKLSSKERRQLRNKVSARAFRSRRKEYITQLESEIANKVSENGDLRAQNRALIEENKRLSDLSRMLLSSPSFSNFLDQLSSNPSLLPAAPQPSAPIVEQRQAEQSRQLPKDVNPYLAQQQMQQQRIGMAMIPEPTIDFSTLNLETDAFGFQPQVFVVLETPEVPVTIEASVLSGKESNFVGPQYNDADDDKVEMPVIERPAAEKEKSAKVVEEKVDEEFESDPAFALYHSTTTSSSAPSKSNPVAELDIESLSDVEIFGGIESEKVLARYELVDTSVEDATVAVSMARVQRQSARLEQVMARLESLTLDL